MARMQVFGLCCCMLMLCAIPAVVASTDTIPVKEQQPRVHDASIIDASASAQSAPIPAHQKTQRKALHKLKTVQFGVASWYGPYFQGKRTASGRRFDMRKMTAAHRSLPLGTKVRVTNLENGRSVEVTIDDRGPYVRRRLIDLSKAAARKLGITRKEGLALVRLESVRSATQFN